MARELHDTVSQTLYAITLTASREHPRPQIEVARIDGAQRWMA